MTVELQVGHIWELKMAIVKGGVTISLLAGSEGTLSATWWLICEAVVLEPAASGASLQ